MKTQWLQKAVETALCDYTSKQIASYRDKNIYTQVNKTDDLHVTIYWWHAYPSDENEKHGYARYTTQEALRIFLAS